MNAFSNTTNSKAAPEKWDWLVFAVATVIVDLMVWLLCPRWAFQPRPTSYWFFVSATLLILAVPFGWSVYLLFIYRSLRERIVAYISLVTSIFFLLLAQELAFEVLRRVVIYGR